MTTVQLSNIGAEQVRNLRARLNGVPKGSLGDKSVGPLTKGFFDVCARVDLSPAAAAEVASPADLKALAKSADLAALQSLVGALQKQRADNPAGWRAWWDEGVLQAILSRRLVLAGRLPADS